LYPTKGASREAYQKACGQQHILLIKTERHCSAGSGDKDDRLLPVISGFLRSALLGWDFFRQNCSLYRTYLQTDTAINTGGKINPIPIRPLRIFAGSLVNTRDWAGFYTICYTLADIRNNCMGHGFSFTGAFDNHYTGTSSA
jgi:hypothetical protein